MKKKEENLKGIIEIQGISHSSQKAYKIAKKAVRTHQRISDSIALT